MAVPPRQFVRRVHNRIKETRISVIEHRKQRTSALLKIIEADLPKFAEEGREAMARLLENDGVHRRHVPGYLDFASLLGAYRNALNVGRFEIETAVALVQLGEAARREVMRFIERGQATDSIEVRRIADSWLERNKSDDETYYRDALSLLAKRRLLALRAEAKAFRRLAAKLHDLLLAFESKSSEEKSIVRLEIIEMAREMLGRFRNEFGSESKAVEDWGKISDPAERLLAEADHALNVLASGEFDRELPSIVPSRDFPLPMSYLGKYLRSWSAIEAVRFLARRTEPVSRRYEKRPLERLCAVDIRAGIGSGALGLKSSGFLPWRLFDAKENNVASLLANRRSWDVRRLDINDVEAVEKNMEAVKQSKKQLDLIMGSLPTKPWRTNRPGVNYENELHSAAMNMVGRYEPRAFFFEHSAGLTTEKHAEFYVPMTTFFAEKGYHTAVFELDHSEFGIPQKRKSYYLVGVELRYADRLRHPIVRKPVTPTVAQLIEKIAFPHRTVDGYEEIKGEPSAQLKYDNWSSEWLRTHGQRLTGDLSGAYRKSNKEHWKTLGFDLFPSTDTALEVGKQPEHMGTPMTTPVIKALQGLPKTWSVSSENLHDRMSMLCLATPPVITAAVGRSVHAALTGEQIDLDTDGALQISTSPHLRHPFNIDDMGNAQIYLGGMWKKGILAMRGELPSAMFDNDPFLDQPPETHDSAQGKIRFGKRPS